MVKLKEILLIASILIASTVFTQNSEPVLVKEFEDIKVYELENAHGNVNRIIARAKFNANYMDILCLLKDSDNHKNWIYANKGGFILDSISPYKWVYYSISETPVLLADRDFITDVELTVDQSKKSILVHSVGNPKYKPEVKDLVRIQMIDSRWTIVKIDETHSEAELNLLIDVGGSLPSWLVNMFIANGPFNSFKNMKEQLKLPKYRHCKCGYDNLIN